MGLYDIPYGIYTERVRLIYNDYLYGYIKYNTGTDNNWTRRCDISSN